MAVFDELEQIIAAIQHERQADPAEFFASLGSPSVSIAVLDNGKVTARCYSTVGDGVKTRFQACSISKPVSALAVMRLLDQGWLSLEDNIAQFLPEAIVSSLGPASLVQAITFTHILSHTAGLTAWGFPGYTSVEHPSAEDVILGKPGVNTTPVKLAGIPGRQWRYSGGGFVLLQIALEKITSLPFPKLMEDLVLRPLEMHDSFYGIPEGEVNLAKAHLTGNTPSPVPWHYLPEQATAGLWTTPADLCKVLSALQRSFGGSDTSFLKEETTKRMLTEIDSNEMGLGWVAPKDPGTWFGHTGSNAPGYRSVAMGTANLSEQKGFSNAECGIVVMTNSELGTLPMFNAVQTIKYLKGWREAATAQPNMPFVAPLPLLNQKISEDWKHWQGRWCDGLDEWAIEAASDGQPQARWREAEPIKLVPAAIHSEVFDKGVSHHLALDKIGAVLHLTWRNGNRSVDYMDVLNWKTTILSKVR